MDHNHPIIVESLRQQAQDNTLTPEEESNSTFIWSILLFLLACWLGSQ